MKSERTDTPAEVVDSCTDAPNNFSKDIGPAYAPGNLLTITVYALVFDALLLGVAAWAYNAIAR